MANLTIFANFKIDSEERFQRMKDSFMSFRSICAEQWIVNIRGEYKVQAAAFLEQELKTSLKLFRLESPKGWFHDSRIMAANIHTSHVLFWIEDHLNMAADCTVYSHILSEMEAADIEFLPYSFYWITKRYEWIPQTEMKYITWLDLNHDTFKLLQKKAPDAYIISCLGIFSKKMFNKIIFVDDTRQAIKWPKETPFDFEKSSYDTHWLPIRVGLPKSELFASIDDDSVEPGSSLITRGLYEPRQQRKKMGVPDKVIPLSNPLSACKSHSDAEDFKMVYNTKFYEEQENTSLKSAEAVIPVVLDVFKPQSVIDVGCEVGGWLRVFQKYGVHNILGFDGNELESDKYYVDKNCVRTNVDFTSNQFKIPQKADLLICLGVADHLSQSAADRFIRNLTSGSSSIIFSAAIPGQTGVNHVNEQPPWYWREKFNKLGYYEVDFIRPLIWLNEDISWWYRQNITCYVTKEVLLRNPKLFELAKVHGQRNNPHKLTIINEWVLQNMFAAKASQQNSGIRKQISSQQEATVAHTQQVSHSVASISVVIPTYNRQNMVGNAIRSVQVQTVPVNEILVVDDISTDNTTKVIEELSRNDKRIRYIKLERKGGAQAARNAGIRAATGEWIAFLDSDDEWLPEKMERQLAAARQYHADVVHCEFLVQRDGQVKPYHVQPISGNVLKNILVKSIGGFTTFLIRKEAMVQIGYLDEAITSWQEWDTAIRLAERYKFGFVPEPSFIWHWHNGETISKDNYREALGYSQIIEKHRDKIIQHAGTHVLLTHYTALMDKFKNLNDYSKFQEIRGKAESCLALLKQSTTQNTGIRNISGPVDTGIVSNNAGVTSQMQQQLLKTRMIDDKTSRPVVYKYEKKGYIGAQETVNSARTRGLGITDYVEELWDQKGQTRKVVDTINELIGHKQLNSICEIGPGTGRYMELFINQHRPASYQFYETADDWVQYLSGTYAGKAQHMVTDGKSLSGTPSDSCDMVIAHGVFVYLSFMNSFEYFKDMVRVCKKDGFIVFDMYSDEDFDTDTINTWIGSKADYPVVLPQRNVIRFFEKNGVTLIHSFRNKYGHSFSRYLVFKKTVDIHADRHHGVIPDKFNVGTDSIQGLSLIPVGNQS